MATSRIADLVGRVLGDRYRLTRPLGTGASAHVYMAEDVRLRRRVAIKILHPALAGDQAFLRRFRAEARVVASLHHPHILRVYDSGEEDGTAYLVMELLDGGSLRALLDTGELLTPIQAAAMGADAARALDHAHRRSLVHRDIKPANLIFDDEGRVAVADFGLARALAEASWTEPHGAVLGTARYAAPEQLRSEALDAKADVYSLALVLVEAITGSVPFANDTILGTAMGRLAQPIQVGEASGPLAGILEAAGTVDPAARLDAAGLARALDRVRLSYPPPPPLVLAGSLVGVESLRDGIDRTRLPGLEPGDPAGGPASLVPRSEQGAPDTSGRDTSGRDTSGRDTSGRDTSGRDTSGRDTSGRDTSGRDTAVVPLVVGLDPAPAGPANPTASSPSGTSEAEPSPKGAGRRRGWSRGGWRRRLALLLVVVLLGGAGAAGAILLNRPEPYRKVPDVAHQSLAEARRQLSPFHFHLAVVGRSYDPTVPVGAVLTQRPGAGARLREDQTVTVTLSLGPQPVPVPTDLAGLPQTAASSVLSTLGLQTGAVTRATSMTVAAGDVIASSPDRGTLLPGQAVALVVSSGKPTIEVPTLTGTEVQSYAGAAAALQAAGLGATEQIQFNNTVPKGEVIITDPAPGVTVTVGSTVTVEISKGPDLVRVPPVAGSSVAAAASSLSADGFTVSGVTGNPTAAVTATVPAAGTPVLRGGSVQIVTG
ncbi:MAG: protein kinase domain-containing protein [Acidimicrobiales bacterium]